MNEYEKAAVTTFCIALCAAMALAALLQMTIEG
jgi:hypothetical protein